ncbi:MAG: MerR family transcriptional regulator [Chloroflexi bacterium]|nr:MAG: MerR family transcriptional regulator [Chloroflexota bacterium]
MTFQLIIRASENEPIYSRAVAARLANISPELLRRCEEERLIQARRMTGGGYGYTVADIRQLARIRRLLEDLELDLPAIEVILHLRQQVVSLLQQIEELEQQMARREQELLAEIQHLRRQLAQEAVWR